MHEAARRRRAIAAAHAAGADALLVTHGPDVRYLTGFTGSSGAVALYRPGAGAGAGGRGGAVLFTDGRYTAQAREQAQGLRVVIEKKAPAILAVEWLASAGATQCAFDAGHTTVAALEAMRKALPAGLRRRFLQPGPAEGGEGLMARLRQVKDEDEIGRMRRAAALGCRLFEGVLEHISAGTPEAEVAAQLELQARLGGAEAMSFDTIVASGPRSALPHGRATSARLPRRGFVTLDFGVVLEGYCSDMTRTVHLGPARGPAGQREWDVYHSVLEAQQAAVAAVAPGVTCGEVDEAARAVLRRARLDKAFSHSTGHGVGLEIHEGPRIAAGQKQLLEPGMVITIEPGVYGSSLYGSSLYSSRAAGKPAEGFGIRIEDMVLVTGSGSEVLTSASPKAWIEL
jgi:Xaa-Pro aminopeptidase